METISFPAQAFNNSNDEFAPLPFSKIQSIGSIDSDSNASTARSSINSFNQTEDDQLMWSPPNLQNDLKLTRSSSFRMIVAPFKGDITSHQISSKNITQSPTLTAPQSKIKIDVKFSATFFAEKQQVKVEEPESDEEFEQECLDDSPTGYIYQSNATKEAMTVRLGKRTHRQSELPQGPAIRHKRDVKRARKSPKVPARQEPEDESDLDELVALFESQDDQVPVPAISSSFGSGLRALPGMVRQNATIMMGVHNDCLYM